MKIESKPTIVTSFDHRIRDEWVCVECSGWHDQDGIYRSRLDGVYLEGVNVSGLLTDFDIGEILAAIDPALEAQANDDQYIA